MASPPTTIASQFQAWSIPEVFAVAFAIAYLLLAIRENIWCWFCAGVSTALYVYVFIDARLYMESLLNVFYFGMAIYGWTVWRSGHTATSELPVSIWPLRTHNVAIGSIIVLTAISGSLLSEFTDAAYPYVDSATTWSAIWATFLVARKVLENWWYWFVIDAASVLIYWSRDLQLTSLLFVLYVILIPFGLYRWTRSYREHAVR